MVFMHMSCFMHICIYHILCIYIYMYYIVCIYVYIYYMAGFVHAWEMRLRNQNKWAMAKKIKCPARNFIQQTKKRKAPASLQGLKHSELYAIAARGCIVVKWREQRYNLRGVLLSRFGYNIARVSPDSYKAGAFWTFRQHRERSWPTCGPVSSGILSSFTV